MCGLSTDGGGIPSRLDFLEGGEIGFGFEHPAPCEHLPEDDPRGEDVSESRDGLSSRLFGAHVLKLALQNSILGVIGAVLGLGDSEVCDLHVTLVADQNIGG